MHPQCFRPPVTRTPTMRDRVVSALVVAGSLLWFVYFLAGPGLK